MARTSNEKVEDTLYEVLVELRKFKIDDEFKLIYIFQMKTTNLYS